MSAFIWQCGQAPAASIVMPEQQQTALVEASLEQAQLVTAARHTDCHKNMNVAVKTIDLRSKEIT
ncbi:hypothetical protein [Bremerella cremea]|uniref:hypothetical protein n=1 Tax=Bremerella cremea TaxID=1031537 RepID=UPI0031F0FAD3